MEPQENGGAMLDYVSIITLRSDRSNNTLPSDSGSEADSESTSDGFSSFSENETPSSSSVSKTPFSPCSDDDHAPRTTATKTAARQLGAHILGPQDAERREGRTRVQTRPLN